MTEHLCRLENCTVAQTGVCLVNNHPSDCPNRVAEALQGAPRQELGSPVLEAPVETLRFGASSTLGIDDARALMRRRHGRIVAILGAPDSGKTATLVSLYLLLSHAKLRGFAFAASNSLLAFEGLAQGARDWNGGIPPEQMTSHTELDSGRTSGFLHLKLLRETDGRSFELLLTDLPGEWSTSLIDHNMTERLSFLVGAHAVWILVDGSTLISPEQRMNSLHRLRQLIGRVAVMCSDELPPVHLVVTRLDQGRPEDALLTQIARDVARLGITLAVHCIASFSENPAISPGSGISDLLTATLAHAAASGPFWPDSDQFGTRQSLRLSEGS